MNFCYYKGNRLRNKNVQSSRTLTYPYWIYKEVLICYTIVERFHGKEEVPGSNPGRGSRHFVNLHTRIALQALFNLLEYRLDYAKEEHQAKTIRTRL